MSYDQTQARHVVAGAVAAGRALLSEAEAKQVLTAFGVRVPQNVTLGFDEAPGPALSGLVAPFVLKVMSERIVHKTEFGGVVLNLADADAVAKAIAAMKARLGDMLSRVDSWLVEEMIPQGVEVVVGGAVDPRFGPTVMFGLGGVFVELLTDVAFRICPITRRDAREMIAELKGTKLLQGWRGAEPVALDVLEDILMALGGAEGLLLSLADHVSELDINPLIASASGVVAVDARIILNGKGQP